MKTNNKNTEVTVKHILGETAEVLVTRLDDGKYQFNCDAYVAGEKCRGGFFHLRQAREVIPGKKLGNNVRFWPRMRRALHKMGIEPINIPGGNFPIHYQDEMVIPDYSVSGSHYFVIKRDDIGEILDRFPIDDAGKKRSEKIAQQKAEAEAEAYRQANDPKCIANRIGDKLWYGGAQSIGGEFVKITLISDESSFSVMYPTCRTDLIWPGCCNVPKVLCTAPETGIEYLSGWTAGKLDPRKHSRIILSSHRNTAYLMPNPNLSDEVRDSYRWIGMFDNSDNDGIKPELLANANEVIVEALDLDDNLLNVRYVYSKETGEVVKEFLHIWPFIGDFDWKTEEV